MVTTSGVEGQQETVSESETFFALGERECVINGRPDATKARWKTTYTQKVVL